MTTSEGGGALATLRERVDRLEEAYEFLLAYAAQGHTAATASGVDSEARRQLERSVQALDGIAATARQTLEVHRSKERMLPFVEVLERDASSASAAFEVALAQTALSSQLIDNLNASSHVRALLTDLFLLDEALGTGPGAD